MEQSRQRLLAEFESLRFGERASCESMPPACFQPRTPQPAPPTRPHRLASFWRSATDLRTARAAQVQPATPFASPAQQSRPFDIYPSKPSSARALKFTSNRHAHTSQVSSATVESCANELHAAIGRNDFHQATKLIHAAPHPSIFQMLNPQLQNAVHLAAIADQARLVVALARRGAHVNASDSLGKTPLHYAVAAASDKEREGDLHGMQQSGMTVKALLQHGADLMIKDKEGNCPLALAATEMSGLIEDEVLALETHTQGANDLSACQLR